jgi:hypothetical protein
VDVNELALLQDGFAQIVIGSSLANQSLQIAATARRWSSCDPLVLDATGSGGTVRISGALQGDDAARSERRRRPHHAHGATIEMQGAVLVRTRTVTGQHAGPGRAAPATLHFTQTVTGFGGAGDTLALSAGGGSVSITRR